MSRKTLLHYGLPEDWFSTPEGSNVLRPTIIKHGRTLPSGERIVLYRTSDQRLSSLQLPVHDDPIPEALKPGRIEITLLGEPEPRFHQGPFAPPGAGASASAIPLSLRHELEFSARARREARQC